MLVIFFMKGNPLRNLSMTTAYIGAIKEGMQTKNKSSQSSMTQNTQKYPEICK